MIREGTIRYNSLNWVNHLNEYTNNHNNHKNTQPNMHQLKYGMKVMIKLKIQNMFGQKH